ncbi:MAG: hypothetical protein IH612_07655 [Desulfofustis sp.]|nr:hypothetical protein [Desulfofustis sp.]
MKRENPKSMTFPQKERLSGTQKWLDNNAPKAKGRREEDTVKTPNRTIQGSCGTVCIGLNRTVRRDDGIRTLRAPSVDRPFVIENQEVTSLVEVLI